MWQRHSAGICFSYTEHGSACCHIIAAPTATAEKVLALQYSMSQHVTYFSCFADRTLSRGHQRWTCGGAHGQASQQVAAAVRSKCTLSCRLLNPTRSCRMHAIMAMYTGALEEAAGAGAHPGCKALCSTGLASSIRFANLFLRCTKYLVRSIYAPL